MSRRSKNKHPNLVPNLNTKVRQDQIDYDYLDKLSEEEKNWLNQFTGEYLGGNFKKSKRGKYLKSNIHNGSAMRKDCYNRNNRRNNDIYSITKGNDMLKDDSARVDYLEAISGSMTKDDVENKLIEAIEPNDDFKKT